VDLEQALKTAIEFENKVRDVYMEACEKASDDTGRKVFKALADEEQGHVDYLESRLAEWRRTGAIEVESLDTVVPSREHIERGVDAMEKSMTEHDRGEEIRMLQKALVAEIETANFYQRMVKELPEEHRPLFKRFLEIEEGHQLIVQTEIDQLLGTGFWFDFQEFNLEAG